MQLQGIPAGIEPASSGLLDQCSTTELQKLLPTTWARVQYIYINEMAMPVKYKGISIIIFGIHTELFKYYLFLFIYSIYIFH